MRIISGTLRGLRLKSPKSMNIRPTSDRVKESVFNIINSNIADSFVLDLFSGTGSLGIECLSRGAYSCTFVDNSKESISILKENLNKARMLQKSDIIFSDVISALNKLAVKRDRFDIIFMDPPYLKKLIIPALETISKSEILEEDGIIIVEHDSKDVIPDKVGNLTKYREKQYSSTKISFFKWSE
ncbi:16S rRNA (guanine(966)-N(2))-methyltransferase RsmD [Alkalithermobacter thermoalcaliphilus JW-YL-7 = DSM 7308]|uniref:Methyltransferase n=1 Tax=Alkalithermobacter thermoalcaliphilus JW-YL-7 = DSM 7308 TaxID=1121328 RepID=A0A150FPR6_CLOPD|nr:methyltransferase [[Clostridium] paradoxum JW-YL-7 = DSM 7308]SHK95848.1 16S rRNA (guanine(966)-N(2))-methyltransferase RsmD [[Clostridium] paradoxum JW-YL-7 = DSM 7308]